MANSKRSARRPRKRPNPRVPDRKAELRIEHLADQGDGYASDDGQAWYVPGTLPGDRVAVRAVGHRGKALLGEVVLFHERAIEPTPDLCSHNAQCGGCQVQHLGAEREAEWKRDRVLRLLSRAFDISVEELEERVDAVVDVPDRDRIRADLAARYTQSGVVLGFQGRGSAKIVDLNDCAVLHPKLFGLLTPLKEILAVALEVGQRGGVHLTWSEVGADVVLSAPNGLGLEAREKIQRVAAENPIARISLDLGRGEVETVLHLHPVSLSFGDAQVALPPKGFLQASGGGAVKLQQWVSEAVDRLLTGQKVKGATVIELYAGIGTLGLPLASRGMKVQAFEQNAAAVAAANKAARTATLSYRSNERDLTDEPLKEDEISDGAIVLLDPPRAGAQPSIENIAVAEPLGVVYVSCDPHSFVKDAQSLIQQGFHLIDLKLLNQFKYTSHVELVACFGKLRS